MRKGERNEEEERKKKEKRKLENYCSSRLFISLFISLSKLLSFLFLSFSLFVVSFFIFHLFFVFTLRPKNDESTTVPWKGTDVEVQVGVRLQTQHVL